MISDVFTMARIEDFKKIGSAISGHVNFFTPDCLSIKGDSLEIIKQFPEHSVSLILTDPPYHSTKKINIYGDTSFEEDKHYLEWMGQYVLEWKRVLRPNGSLFCFCSPSMAARLEVLFSDYFNILSQIVWTKPNDPGFDGWKQKAKKESLRHWYSHSERIIFAEPAVNKNLFRSYFGYLLRECRKKSGLTMKALTGIIGAYGKINHGGAVSNWEAGRNVPSEGQYEKLRAAMLNTGKVESMPEYRDLVRPFNIDGTKEFTDIWTFPTIRPYKGKHPAEKPIALLKHAIEATTYPGDIVLDCFGGSGTTAVAALKLGRYAITIEIDPAWVDKTKQLLEKIETKRYTEYPDNYKAKETMVPVSQESLFDL